MTPGSNPVAGGLIGIRTSGTVTDPMLFQSSSLIVAAPAPGGVARWNDHQPITVTG